MADNHFSSTIDALFRGLDQFVTTKTVVGEALKVDDAIILWWMCPAEWLRELLMIREKIRTTGPAE